MPGIGACVLGYTCLLHKSVFMCVGKFVYVGCALGGSMCGYGAYLGVHGEGWVCGEPHVY